MSGTEFVRLNLHIGDYLKSTRHLRPSDHGAYFMLILHYWLHGGLPIDDGRLAIIAGMTPAEWRKHKPILAALFEPNWKSPRLDAEIAGALRARKRRSDAGKKGNKVRWDNDRYAEVDDQVFGKRSQCDPNAIAMGSLPLAARHMEEPDQGRNSSEERADEDQPDIVPFIRRVREGAK